MSMESFPKPKKTPEQKLTTAEGSPGEPKPPAAEQPNFDNFIQQNKEQGIGENGASPIANDTGDSRIRYTDQPGDFTPELFEEMRNEYGGTGNQSESPSPSEQNYDDLASIYGSDGNRYDEGGYDAGEDTSDTGGNA